MRQNIKIIQEGHPTLSKKATPFEFPLKSSYKGKLEEMMKYLIDSQNEEIAIEENLRAGVGLAAPQIDWLKRGFVIYIDYGDEVFEETFLNPTIISHSIQKCYLGAGEGCLSVDLSIAGYVPRHQRITVKYFDIDGNEKEMRLRDYEAIVFQHEYDHLNGILFTMKTTTDLTNLKKI